MSTYRIVIDRSLCTGYGMCAELAPDVFELDAEERVSIRTGTSEDPNVVEAADMCPLSAIAVYAEAA